MSPHARDRRAWVMLSLAEAQALVAAVYGQTYDPAVVERAARIVEYQRRWIRYEPGGVSPESHRDEVCS